MINRGFALVAVLVACLMITTSATLVYAMTELNAQITYNQVAHTKAKLAATSGLNHFISLGLHYEDLREISQGRDGEFIVLESRTIDNDYYRVSVVLDDDDIFYVYSKGEHVTGERIVASAETAASFQSLWMQK